MKNKTRLSKRIVAFFVFLIFTFNSFAAVVSDNDGAAFITKGEFDSLKNSFQSQVDNYNRSIDSKIDGAIASYLAGVKLKTKVAKTVQLNKDDEKILFMSKNTTPSLINFWGTVGIDGDAISVADHTGADSYLHGGQIWKTHLDNRPFLNAITRLSNNQIKLMKNVKIQWTIVNYTTSSFFDSPSNPSAMSMGLHYTDNHYSSYHTYYDNSIQTKMKGMVKASNQFIYFGPAYKRTLSSYTYLGYNNYYVQLPPWGYSSWNWLPRSIEWVDYTDDNIRCLFSGESEWASIATFKDPLYTKFTNSDNVWAQANGAPYRAIDQSVSFYILRSSLSSDREQYKGDTYKCSNWLTYDDSEVINGYSHYSLLPPIDFLTYDSTPIDLKDFSGAAINMNDGYPFFTNADKAGTLDFELECVTGYGSGWNVFVTDEPMLLSNKTTTKTKVNIKKQGDASYSQSVTWTDTAPLKLTIEIEQDKTYYIYVMNTSTGQSPIFKFAPKGTQTIIQE